MPIDYKGLCTWECPDCHCDNTLFTLERGDLPERLACSFCDHISPEITWKDKDAEGKQ